MDVVEFGNLLIEVRQSHIDELLRLGQQSRLKQNLPFGELFDNDPDKLRVAIPFQAKGAEEVVEWLTNSRLDDGTPAPAKVRGKPVNRGNVPIERDFMHADLETGYISKYPLNPDGSMRNPVRIGKAVAQKRARQQKALAIARKEMDRFADGIIPEPIYQYILDVVRKTPHTIPGLEFGAEPGERTGTSLLIPPTQAVVWRWLCNVAKRINLTVEDLADGEKLLEIIRQGLYLAAAKPHSDPRFPEWKIPDGLIDASWAVQDAFKEDMRGQQMEKKWASEGAGFQLILSRAPVDVLRMSDFDNIQSCHSVDGSYWKCAQQEAYNGGPVAYLVTNNQLSQLGAALSTGVAPALFLQRDRLKEEHKRFVTDLNDGKFQLEMDVDEASELENGFAGWVGYVYGSKPDPAPFIHLAQQYGYFDWVDEEDFTRMPTTEEVLQADEMFKDSDRNVPGINPTARIRIRRYVKNPDRFDVGGKRWHGGKWDLIDNEDFPEDIAVPETRVYGNDVSGFYEGVKDYLLDGQGLINRTFPMIGYCRVGGSYQDSSDSALWNTFMDVTTNKGDVPFIGEDEEEHDMGEQFFDEANAYLEARNPEIEPFHACADVAFSDDAVEYVVNTTLTWEGVFPRDALAPHLSEFDNVSLHDVEWDEVAKDDPEGYYDMESFMMNLERAFRPAEVPPNFDVVAEVGSNAVRIRVHLLPPNAQASDGDDNSDSDVSGGNGPTGYYDHPDEMNRGLQLLVPLARDKNTLRMRVWHQLAPWFLVDPYEYKATDNKNREYYVDLRNLGRETMSRTYDTIKWKMDRWGAGHTGKQPEDATKWDKAIENFAQWSIGGPPEGVVELTNFLASGEVLGMHSDEQELWDKFARIMANYGEF